MHISPRVARPAVAVLTATALAISGCGGGEQPTPTRSPSAAGTSSPAKSARVLSLQADQSQLKFDKSALSAKPGKVTIVMKNPSALPHDVAIEGHGVDVKGKTVSEGGTSTVTARLKAGTYTFYCSVDSHRQAGMEGRLTVR